MLITHMIVRDTREKAMRIACPLLFLSFFVCPVAAGGNEAEAQKPKLQLEIEIERSESMSRLTVYVRNNTEKPFTFRTGSRGGAGSLDDGVRLREDKTWKRAGARWIVGTAPTIIPELRFRIGEDGYISLRPPTLGGPVRRAIRPHVLEVPADDRVLYASFAVASESVSGKFVEAKLKIDDQVTLRTTDIKEIDMSVGAGRQPISAEADKPGH